MRPPAGTKPIANANAFAGVIIGESGRIAAAGYGGAGGNRLARGRGVAPASGPVSS